jgi:aspartyl/glutamyl-tRNA(Asn/Gln) amidotransferase C subunit
MNPTEVRRLAGLARIHLTEAEVERFAGQLGSVVEYFEILQTLPAAPHTGAASTREAEQQ